MTDPKEIEAGEAKLKEMGFDPAAPPDQALAALRALRGKPGVGNAAIASALGKLTLPGAADMLAEMETQASGAERREIRRALFKLRQRGISPTAEAVPAAGPRPALGAPPETTTLSALLSPIDAEGARIVWIFKSRPQGGVNRLWGLATESEGLVSVRIAALSRRELRAERAELEKRAALKMIEADWRLADFILCEAYRLTPEAHRREAGNFFALRAEIIASSPPADFTHPVYAELAAEAAADPSPELLKEPEIAAWKLPDDEVKPYADEVRGLRESTIILNQVLQQERVDAVVGRALAELLSGDRATRVRRRLEDTAYYMARTGRRTAAGWAAAAAAKIRDGAELKRFTFFQGFIRTQLGEILAEQRQREEQEPRLIMTPAEAMRARASRMRQR